LKIEFEIKTMNYLKNIFGGNKTTHGITKYLKKLHTTFLFIYILLIKAFIVPIKHWSPSKRISGHAISGQIKAENILYYSKGLKDPTYTANCQLPRT
jgi:hypothetical protein